MAKDHSLDVTSSRSDYRSLQDNILRALEKALNIMNAEPSKVEVSLLNKKEMAELNETYKKKEGPTNVLSFSEPEEIPEMVGNFNYLGEIYLCPEVIKEREEDVIYLSVHGLLHLFGYTHKNKSDTIKMEKKEKEIMKKING